MAMYDYLNNISRNIEQQASVKETKSTKKFKIENNILVKLEYFIKHYKTKGKNIYDVNVQDEIIQKTLYSVFGDLETQHDYNNIEDYVNNYQVQNDRVDEDYYYLFCMKNYLKSCRNVENLIKKSNELTNKDDYKKQIAIEKWDLQKQIMQQKLNEKAQKEAEKTQKQTIKLMQLRNQQRQIRNEAIMQYVKFTVVTISKIMLFMMKASLYIALMPLKIAALFMGGFLGGMIKLR